MSRNLTALIFTLFVTYIGYHAIFGAQGLASWSRMQAKASELEVDRDALFDKALDLKKKNNKLRDEAIDLDYVEELARTKFFFVYSDEIVFEPPTNTKQLPENEDLFELSN